MLTLLFLLIWKILCYFFMLLWVHLKKKAILVWGIEVLIPDYYDDEYGYSHPLENHIDKNEWVYITRIVTKGYFDYLYKKGYRNEYDIKELLKKYPHPSKAEDSIIDNNIINFLNLYVIKSKADISVVDERSIEDIDENSYFSIIDNNMINFLNLYVIKSKADISVVDERSIKDVDENSYFSFNNNNNLTSIDSMKDPSPTINFKSIKDSSSIIDLDPIDSKENNMPFSLKDKTITIIDNQDLVVENIAETIIEIVAGG